MKALCETITHRENYGGIPETLGGEMKIKVDGDLS